MSVEGERELEEFLAGALSGKAEEAPPEPPPTTEPEVVHDERPGFEPPLPDGTPTPPVSPEPVEEIVPGEEEIPPEEGEEDEDRNVVWATKKYGKEPAAWAKAAFEQEQHISRLASAKDEAEAVAREAIQYAQQVEAQAQQTTAMGMPLSAQEEAWIEQNMANPGAAAYQAARAGNVNLYNGVLEMVAAENPGMAVQIGTQVQMALQEEARQAQAAAAAQTNGAQQADFPTELGQSFARIGVDVQKYGPAMWQKLEELGEYHQYTLAILGGDAIQRDLAVRAVYDLIRQGETTTRKVVDEQREAQIRREGELRREAASVVTGSPHAASAQQQSPLFEAMEQEWRRRGQWRDEE